MSNKVDMSLDDIIKMSKKEKKGQKGAVKKAYVTKQALQRNLQRTSGNVTKQALQRNMPKTSAKAGKQPQRQTGQFRTGFQNRQTRQGQGKTGMQTEQQRGSVQNRLGRRQSGSPQKLQQNRVNRPNSRASNASSVSDAKLLKIAKALLSKKVGATMLGDQLRNHGNAPANVQRQTVAPQTQQRNPRANINQQARTQNVNQNRNQRRNRQQNQNLKRTATEDVSSVLTVSVQNELAHLPLRRKRLNRPSPPAATYDGQSIIIETRNPMVLQRQVPAPAPAPAPAVAARPSDVSDIVRSMKPKVHRNYDFSADAFHQVKQSSVPLSQRFSGAPSSAPAAPSGSRQVYL